MGKLIAVFTTTAKKKDAEAIANSLINKNLAACVQILGPIQSFYKWKNKKKNTEEWLSIIKTKDKSYKKAEAEIKRLHKYEIPEIVTIKISGGSKEYLHWLEEQTG